VGQCGANQAGRAEEVDVQDAVPFLVCDVLHSAGGADAGVGHNDIETAQLFGDLGYRIAYGRVVANVTGNFKDVLLRLCERSQVQGRHGRASRTQRSHGGSANPAGATGDEGAYAIDIDVNPDGAPQGEIPNDNGTRLTMPNMGFEVMTAEGGAGAQEDRAFSFGASQLSVLTSAPDWNTAHSMMPDALNYLASIENLEGSESGMISTLSDRVAQADSNIIAVGVPNIAELPPLPKELAYRQVGVDLVLIDAASNFVVDVLRCAVFLH